MKMEQIEKDVGNRSQDLFVIMQEDWHPNPPKWTQIRCRTRKQAQHCILLAMGLEQMREPRIKKKPIRKEDEDRINNFVFEELLKTRGSRTESWWIQGYLQEGS